MQIVANNLGNALVPDLTGDVQAADNRTPRHRLIFEQDPAPGTIVTVGTHVVTVTVTDLRGNSTECHRTLEVVSLVSQEPVNILDPEEATGTVVELDVEAETNFDGSEVVLTWTFPDGVDASSTVFIQRDGLLIATATGTTYTDTTVESGETYVYLVTVSTLAGGTTTQCCIFPPGTTVFSNTAQTATVSCPVGTTGASKSVTVPANTFTSSSSQADADALALASATAQATALLCCCETCEDGLVLYDDCFPYGYGYEGCLSVYDENCYPYGYGFGEFPVFPSSAVDHWWKMEEAGSAVRRDAIATIPVDLTASVVSGTIGRQAGKVGFACVQTGSVVNLQGAGEVYANTGWTLFGWVLVSTDFFTTVQISYLLRIGAVSQDALQLSFTQDLTGANNTLVFSEAVSGTPVCPTIDITSLLDTWIFYRAWHDGPNGKLRIQLNNGSIFESPTAWTPAAHTSTLMFFNGGSTTRSFDETGMMHRVLTAAEATYLWNNGNGRTWPFA